jgi:hypothetical protein
LSPLLFDIYINNKGNWHNHFDYLVKRIKYINLEFKISNNKIWLSNKILSRKVYIMPNIIYVAPLMIFKSKSKYNKLE